MYRVEKYKISYLILICINWKVVKYILLGEKKSFYIRYKYNGLNKLDWI